jgi:hypothetical protein
MQISSLSKLSLGTIAAAAFLAACSGNTGSTVPGVGGVQSQSRVTHAVHAIPAWLLSPAGIFHGNPMPDKKKKSKGLIYVSSFAGDSVFGFTTAGKSSCSINTGDEAINGNAADPKGNLILPLGAARTVSVYKPNCGAEIGASFADNDGQPSSASSFNAATGTIAIGNITSTATGVGSVDVCTVSGGCTSNITSSNITGYGGGVLLDTKGNCYLTSENASFTASTMTYWAGCKGSGTAVTGWKNTYYGSITLDKKGNIDAIDFEGGGTGQLWVYKGCNPACTLVGGPFALHGYAIFGSVNKKGNTFGAVEFETGEVDLYKYSPTKLTYTSSFSSGFSATDEAEGFAFAPSVKK